MVQHAVSACCCAVDSHFISSHIMRIFIPTILLSVATTPYLYSQQATTAPAAAPSTTHEVQSLYPAAFPWSHHIPESIREQYIEPNQMLDEPTSAWRSELKDIITPLVKDCKDAREAALLISTKIKEVTGVDYSTKRIRPNMSPIETLRTKRASCTGLSILYAAALRSVDIPSRIVGVETWNHVPGNHTWTEVWLNGEWQMLEMGEKHFNTGWVMEAVGMLDTSKPRQRVLATTGKIRDMKSKAPHFQVPWNRLNKSLEAQDVSDRYIALANAWYEKQGLDPNMQRILVDVLPQRPQKEFVKLVDSKGKVIDSGQLPTPQDDMRKMLPLNLPRTKGKTYYLIFPHGEKIKVTPTDAPTQVLRFYIQRRS